MKATEYSILSILTFCGIHSYLFGPASRAGAATFFTHIVDINKETLAGGHCICEGWFSLPLLFKI